MRAMKKAVTIDKLIKKYFEQQAEADEQKEAAEEHGGYYSFTYVG